MDCLLIKVTSTKPRIKLPSLQFNTFYPLTELDTELKQLSSQLKKPLIISLKLVELAEKRQEVDFKKLEIDKSFTSLLYLLNEDIFQSEREAEFDEAEQFRQLSQKLATQFISEQADMTPYLMAAEEQNQGVLSKLFKKKLPVKKEVETSSEMTSAVSTDKKETKQSVPPTQVEVKETIKPLPEEVDSHLVTESPVWEDEEIEPLEVTQGMPSDLVESNKPQPTEPRNKPSQSSQTMNSTATFLSFESFLQIKDDNPLVSDVVEELNRDKAQPIESVAEALGINLSHPTPLEEKQLDFIRKRTDRQLFQRLQLRLTDNINQLEISLNKTLENLYLESGLVEHDLRAFVQQKKAEKEKELGAIKNKEYRQLKDQLDEEKRQKLETLTIKHQSELQELKAKQLDETQRVESDFDIYSQDKLQRLTTKLSEEVESELESYHSQLQSERQENLAIQLLSKKESLLSKRNEAIINEVTELQHEKQTYYESLLNELVEKENDFLLLIKQEEMAQQKEKEQQLKERELDIKQEEVTLLSNEHNQKSQQQTELSELMMSLIQAQLLKATQTNPETTVPQTIEVNVPSGLADKLDKPFNLRRLLYSVGILSLIPITFLGTKLYQANQENQSIRTEVAKIEQATQKLSESMTTMTDENTKLKKELVKSKESLANLLAEENYERAIELYPNELDTIEMSLYDAGDLKQLKLFNQSHTSRYGRLDEAILSGNQEKIIAEYHKLETKEPLPGNRNSHIPQEALYEEWE